MNKFKFLLLVALSMSVGCSNKSSQTTSDATATSDMVQQTLGLASEEAHANLAMLAKLRGKGAIPILPAPDTTLDSKVTINWTGPANEALKTICLQVGYKYIETGRKRAQELPVVVNGSNRSAYDIIEDIAWQIQPNAVVRVDSIKKTLTLAGAGSERAGHYE